MNIPIDKGSFIKKYSVPILFMIFINCTSYGTVAYRSGQLEDGTRIEVNIINWNGYEKYCYANNKLKFEVCFESGKKERVAKYYYECGVLKEEVYFYNNKPNGLKKSIFWKWWYSVNIIIKMIN